MPEPKITYITPSEDNAGHISLELATFDQIAAEIGRRQLWFALLVQDVTSTDTEAVFDHYSNIKDAKLAGIYGNLISKLDQ